MFASIPHLVDPSSVTMAGVHPLGVQEQKVLAFKADTI